MITTPLSITLPAEIRQALVAAAAVTDPRQRTRLIDEIVERARRIYPKFFKREGAAK